MKPFYWVLLALTGILSAVLLMAGVAAHTSKPTIYDVSEATYASMVTSVVGTHNSHFNKESVAITDIQYVEDSIAVVKTTVGSTPVVFLFECYNGTVFLTNYSANGFTEDDINNASIIPQLTSATS